VEEGKRRDGSELTELREAIQFLRSERTALESGAAAKPDPGYGAGKNLSGVQKAD
jgi:hypothetical protein